MGALFLMLQQMNPIFASLSFHALVLSATVLVSWLSYRLIETRFLDLKRHFSQPSLARSHTASI